MKKILYFLAILSIAILSQNCSKDSDNAVDYSTITSDNWKVKVSFYSQTQSDTNKKLLTISYFSGSGSFYESAYAKTFGTFSQFASPSNEYSDQNGRYLKIITLNENKYSNVGYYSNGYIKSIDQYSTSSNTFLGKTEYVRLSNNNIDKIIKYDAGSNEESTTYYSYGSNGFVSKTLEFFPSDTGVKSAYEYFYNSDGYIVRQVESYEKASYDTTDYEYSNGKVMTATRYNKGETKSLTSYEYKNGLLAKQYYNGVCQIEYFYNANNNIITKRNYISNSVWYDYLYEYEYK